MHVTLNNIVPTLPPAQQNQLFGDDLLFAVHSAKTSAQGEGDYLAFEFVASDQTFVFDRPETGLMQGHGQRRLDQRGNDLNGRDDRRDQEGTAGGPLHGHHRGG